MKSLNISEIDRHGVLETEMAARLSALGSPIRLNLFRLLVRKGKPGLSVGEIRQAMGVPASTLSHHISILNDAGLILQRRSGRATMCSVDYSRVTALLAYLTDECCVDEPTALPGSDPAYQSRQED